MKRCQGQRIIFRMLRIDLFLSNKLEIGILYPVVESYLNKPRYIWSIVESPFIVRYTIFYDVRYYAHHIGRTTKCLSITNVCRFLHQIPFKNITERGTTYTAWNNTSACNKFNIFINTCHWRRVSLALATWNFKLFVPLSTLYLHSNRSGGEKIAVTRMRIWELCRRRFFCICFGGRLCDFSLRRKQCIDYRKEIQFKN